MIEGVDNRWAEQLFEQLKKGTEGDTSGPTASDTS
jgi:hypothetical protein